MGQRDLSVVAAFTNDRVARRAVEDLSRQGVSPSHIRVVPPDEVRDRARVGELRAEMQEEVVHSVAGPSIGLLAPDQARGAFPGAVGGGLIGLFLGAIAGVLWANVVDSSISELGRIVIAAASLMVAGGTIGFIAGGAMKPRIESMRQPDGTLDEKRLTAERATLVAVEAADDREHEIAHAVLESAGATRVDDVDPQGEPLPPQAEHPRPADPPEWWSNGGRHKG